MPRFERTYSKAELIEQFDLWVERQPDDGQYQIATKPDAYGFVVMSMRRGKDGRIIRA